jgi:uncharacterized protein (TIGR03435 family)
MMAMLQKLLEHRFKLTIHREAKEMPVYALVVGKNGPKIQAVKDDDGGTQVDGGDGHPISARNLSMEGLAQILSRRQQTDRPVLDRTGLKGIFNFTLDFATDDAASADGTAAPSIFTAVQEQLGLKLEATKGPVEIVVIDRVEKPSDNFEPQVAAAQAIQGPAQDGPALFFEVASVKLSKADAGDRELGAKPGRRLSATNATLKMLIQSAYQMKPYQLSGGPDWLALDGFDIEAKPGNPNASAEQFRQMFQKLLEDRFQLKVHFDTKELPIYTLVVAKRGAKLQVSKGDEPDATMRANYGLMTGIRATMPMLASSLSARVERQVVDETGLKGAYNFKLEFTPEPDPAWPDERRPPPPGDHPSIFTALQEQLGLNLKAGKGPVQVLVIDHAGKPTDNAGDGSDKPAAKFAAALAKPARPAAAQAIWEPAQGSPALSFEVASIKSAPDVRFPSWSISPESGMLNAKTDVKGLIEFAYGLHMDFQVSGGPGWLNSEKYTVVAKAARPASRREFQQMMQGLLADRFKLTIHRETKSFLCLRWSSGIKGRSSRQRNSKATTIRESRYGVPQPGRI